MFQFNIVFGILIAFVSNALLAGIGENAWRWMLGVAAFPSLLYALFCFGLPESPRWLLEQKGRPRGRLEGSATHRARSLQSRDRSRGERNYVRPRRRKGLQRISGPAACANRSCSPFLIAFFNQLSGINAILYFAPRIFELTGLGAKAALLQSIGIGVTNLIFTFVGLWLIDRLGRRTLLFIGSFGYIASLGLVAWAFFTEHYSIVPACIFAFIAAHAIGQGAVIWVFISEIFPNRQRAEGQALGSFTHWIFAALLTTFFPQDGFQLSARLRLLVLCRHDGAATHLGEDDGSGNERRAAGANSEATGHRIDDISMDFQYRRHRRSACGTCFSPAPSWAERRRTSPITRTHSGRRPT